MNNSDGIKQLISTITGEENYYFTVNRILVKFMDSLEGGIFLNQLIYWSDRSIRSDGFFYKSAKEWYEEIHLSEYHINKHIKRLREAGIVETKKLKANGAPTIHYKLNIDALYSTLESFLKNLEMETEKFGNGNQNILESIPKNLEMETQKFENGNQKIQESIPENYENDSEKFRNGNQKISESLTKTTTKTISKNTTKTSQEITKKEYNNNYQQGITTNQPPAPNISYSVDSKYTEKIKEVGGGRSVPFQEQLEQLVKSYEFAIGPVDETISKSLMGFIKLYKDHRLIAEALKELSQTEPPNNISVNDIPKVISKWKSNGIYNYDQLIAKQESDNLVESSS
ncbi:helix-turn-helix domain-containing protein [Rummeliibacillus sp. POC4]|uniref:helix-turn-helix domain-containing protein n=1 Tax=Rummeliibacillus sp. POC4 TaxID=2305899 RepID=UPI000E671E30|nr:helix-turn-helix domain-containing protein [Rummeliibacillus sp. POC4]RIJ64158.1 transcriptional regulator [Rummeliibacillus sp. POC4]